MKLLLCFGILLFIVGIVFVQTNLNGSLFQSLVFLVAISFGIAQLVRHLLSVYRMKNTPLGYKVILTWFLLCFGLISGYIITLICLYKKTEEFSDILQSRSQNEAA